MAYRSQGSPIAFEALISSVVLEYFDRLHLRVRFPLFAVNGSQIWFTNLGSVMKFHGKGLFWVITGPVAFEGEVLRREAKTGSQRDRRPCGR